MFSLPDLSRLKEMRTTLGWSQAELAHHAGVSQSLIAKIEAGTLDPSLSHAQRIAKALAAEMPTGATVQDVMSRKILSFPPSTPVLEAVRAMRKRGISQMPVMHGAAVVGRVNESCILERVEDLSRLRLSDVMLSPPPLVDKATPVSAILPLFQAYNMVLVQERGEVVGIVTRSDIMAAALQKKL